MVGKRSVQCINLFGRAARDRTASCAYALARLVRPRADLYGRTKSFERKSRRPWHSSMPARRDFAQLAVMSKGKLCNT